MEIRHTDRNDRDFLMLCEELDRYLDQVADGDDDRDIYRPLNTLEEVTDVWVAYDDGTPVGCASLKKYSRLTAEVKRVYVRPTSRGREYGKLLMQEVEKSARAQNYRKVILETGEPLVEARRLFEGLGYERIQNYGPYRHLDQALCMQKTL